MSRARGSVAVLVPVAWLVLGCGAAEKPSAPSGAAPLEVTFESCPRFSDTGAGEAECTTVALPLMADDPDGATIGVFVKRFPASEPRRGALWLLVGAPGVAGSSSEREADRLAQALPFFDVYLPDHRGSGQSERLTCDALSSVNATPAELDACGRELRARYGRGLYGFRTTEAARDVAAVIGATRERGDSIVALGESYGGHWLHRLFELAPGLIDRAVFESSSLVYARSTAQEALAPDEAGTRLLELCAEDAACAERLGTDPYAQATNVLRNAAACQAFGSPPPGYVPMRLAQALLDDNQRALVPAFFSRLERCEAADLDFMSAFLDAASSDLPPGVQATDDFGAVLSLHLGMSELRYPARQAALTEIADSTLFNRAIEMSFFNDAPDAWPVYPIDALQDRLALTIPPTLIIHGALDAVTPPSLARTLAVQFGPGATLVELPNLGYGLGRALAAPDGEESCALGLMRRFLSQPDAVLDTSCAGEVTPFAFTPDETWLDETLGTTDVWDNP